MTNYTIPKPNAPFSDGGTPPRREWYNFLRGLYDLYESSDASVQAQITDLCYKLGSPDGTIANIPPIGNISRVVGIDSIISNGLNYVQLNLDGDVVTAPALTFYGAISAGSKGWQPYSTNFQKTTTGGIDYLDLVDLADSGAGSFKLLTRDSKGRLSGTANGAASDVPVTSSGWDVVTGSNVQTALDSIDAELLHNAGTGMHYGMQITINGTNPSAVDISAGNGQILDNTIPASPTFTVVTYAGQTGIAVANTSAPITYWSIDATGTIQQATTAPTPDQYRTSIQLGSTVYNGGQITQVIYDVGSLQQTTAQICDLFNALGTVNYGVQPYANGANLNFNMSSGRLSACGANFFTDPLDPNFISVPTKVPVTFRYGTQSSQGTVDTTTVDVGNYDVGGVITAIPGASSRVAIHTVWQSLSGAVRLQYGQQYFTSLAEAQANLSTRTFIVNPTYAAEGTIVGAILAQKGATDLSNTSQALFIKANRFGEFIGGSGSSSSVVSFNGRSGIVVPVSGDYTTDLVTEATNLYFTQPRVLATPLTGLSTATSTPITASDTVLSAAGKLQAQISGISGSTVTSVFGRSGAVVAVSGDYTFAQIGSTPTTLAGYGITDGQPLDATLTALAGANWAANALPIGSGADTVSQVSFAANTFPARASTGNLVAKPISDFGISFVNSASKSAAQTALDLASGTYTPTLFNTTNVSASTTHQCQYMRVGSVVTVSGRVDLTPTSSASVLTVLGISLPIASTFSATFNLGGAGGVGESPYANCLLLADTTNNRALLQYTAMQSGSHAAFFTFTYLII